MSGKRNDTRAATRSVGNIRGRWQAPPNVEDSCKSQV